MTLHPVAEARRAVTRSLHPAITSDAGTFDSAAHADERVVVVLDPPGPEQRTRLMSLVLEAIEAQLDRVGAAPRGWLPADPAESILSDQLYRTRLLGAGGLALRFPALAGIADADGELALEDGRTLRRLFALAEREPLQLFVPEPSTQLCVAGAPQRLSEWLSAGSRAGRIASIEYEVDLADAEGPARDLPIPAALDASEELVPPSLEAFLASEATPATAPSTGALFEQPEAGHGQASERTQAEPAESAALLAKLTSESAAATDNVAGTHAPEAPGEPTTQISIAHEEREMFDEEQAQRCASWAAQLASMNGPKVHASVERAFLTAYLPLAREVAAGKAPLESRRAIDTWAEGFAQSYAAAFKSLNSSLRRPRMVRDIFELGARWLGQSRARNCQLVLIDAMRFDLGQRLNELLEKELGGEALCRDQALLWAALPSNSEAQRIGDLAARPLRYGKAKPSAEPAPPVAAGIQSVRVGSREFLRVDRIAADLARPGESEPARLDRLAGQLADVLVPWMKAQPPDTLVVLFGDHGFYWQASEAGTSAAQRGGALPEQVLVPASAWVRSAPRQKAGMSAGLH